MIMNSNKKVICLNDIESNVIEEAIFILKSNVSESIKECNEKKTEEIAIIEAEEIVNDFIKKYEYDSKETLSADFINDTNLKEIVYIASLLIILVICLAVTF